MPVPVTYRLLYNNKNITDDVSRFAISVTYTDKTEKESDEISIELEDSDQLWQNEWYPEKGAKLYLEIIQDGKILKCGNFTLDEINNSGSKSSGDKVTLRAIATGIKQKLRTRQSFANENKTLRQLAETIASRHGLTLQGTGDVLDLIIDRVTQWRETDIGFLNRIGQEYGAMFSVRDDKLVFTSVYDIEASTHIASLDKIHLIEYDVSDKSFLTYREARVKFHHPTKKKVITYTVKETNPAIDQTKADVLELVVKAETEAQAEAKAKAALYRKNSLQQGGHIKVPGNIRYIAGVNIELTGLGVCSGIYHVTQSEHTITKSGAYECEMEIKRTALIAAEKRKSKATDNATSVYPGDQEINE